MASHPFKISKRGLEMNPQQLGYIAFWKDWTPSDNPFESESTDYLEWEFGWSSALRDWAAGEEENG